MPSALAGALLLIDMPGFGIYHEIVHSRKYFVSLCKRESREGFWSGVKVESMENRQKTTVDG